MGYRLCIEAISPEYCEGHKHGELHNIKQLYYGTKLYGYGLDLEESLSYNFLLAIGKFEDYNTYFGYSAYNDVILNYNELIFFLKLYSIDYDKDMKKDYKDHIEGSFLKQEEIQNIFNNSKLSYKNFLVYWF